MNRSLNCLVRPLYGRLAYLCAWAAALLCCWLPMARAEEPAPVPAAKADLPSRETRLFARPGLFPSDCGQETAHSGAAFSAIKFGLEAAPLFGLAVGMDVTLPRLGIARGLVGRVDVDLIAPFDAPSFLGLPGTKAGVTFSQVFGRTGVEETGLYAGLGIGPYVGEVIRPGVKFFVGGQFGRHVGLELGVHYPGVDKLVYTLHLRVTIPSGK